MYWQKSKQTFKKHLTSGLLCPEKYSGDAFEQSKKQRLLDFYLKFGVFTFA